MLALSAFTLWPGMAAANSGRTVPGKVMPRFLRGARTAGSANRPGHHSKRGKRRSLKVTKRSQDQGTLFPGSASRSRQSCVQAPAGTVTS